MYFKNCVLFLIHYIPSHVIPMPTGLVTLSGLHRRHMLCAYRATMYAAPWVTRKPYTNIIGIWIAQRRALEGFAIPQICSPHPQVPSFVHALHAGPPAKRTIITSDPVPAIRRRRNCTNICVMRYQHAHRCGNWFPVFMCVCVCVFIAECERTHDPFDGGMPVLVRTFICFECRTVVDDGMIGILMAPKNANTIVINSIRLIQRVRVRACVCWACSHTCALFQSTQKKREKSYNEPGVHARRETWHESHGTRGDKMYTRRDKYAERERNICGGT